LGYVQLIPLNRYFKLTSLKLFDDTSLNLIDFIEI